MTTSKHLGNHGTDYTLTLSNSENQVSQYIAKKVAKGISRFDLFKCIGVNEQLIKESITLKECKKLVNN